MDEHDTPIGAVMAAFDQAALLHAIDDPGHARHRDLKGVGEVAHRIGSICIEQRQHVEVNEADRVAMPSAEGGDELARVPGQELVEEGVRQPAAAR